jgi:hypothetical protein
MELEKRKASRRTPFFIRREGHSVGVRTGHRPFEVRAGRERRNLAGRNREGLAGLGIATVAGRLVLDREAADAGQYGLAAIGQSLPQGIAPSVDKGGGGRLDWPVCSASVSMSAFLVRMVVPSFMRNACAATRGRSR